MHYLRLEALRRARANALKMKQRGFIINPYVYGGAAVPTTWDPANKSSNIALSGGDLTATKGSSGNSCVRSTTSKAIGSGVWQFETITTTTAGDRMFTGILNAACGVVAVPGQDSGTGGSDSMGYVGFGFRYRSSSPVAYGATYTSAHYIGVVFDATAGTLTFYKDGVSQGQAYSSISAGPYFAGWGIDSGNTYVCTVNFGATAFAYPIGGATAWG